MSILERNPIMIKTLQTKISSYIEDIKLLRTKPTTVELQYNVLAPSAAKRLVYWSWPLFLDHYFLTQDDLCMYFVYIYHYICTLSAHRRPKKKLQYLVPELSLPHGGS